MAEENVRQIAAGSGAVHLGAAFNSAMRAFRKAGKKGVVSRKAPLVVATQPTFYKAKGKTIRKFFFSDGRESLPTNADYAMELVIGDDGRVVSSTRYMVRRGVVEKHLPGKHDQSTHGKRGGASSLPDVGFRGGVDAESFIAARNMSERSPYISQSSVDDLKGVSLFLSSDDKVGYGVTKDGDLVNVFNNGGEKGSGSAAVLQAISEYKAKTLDCFDGKLPQIYSRAGLVPVGRMKFDENYAPAGWDYAKNDHPDVVFMAYQGGSRKGLGRRYGKFEKYDAAAGRYFTDYDQAKSASLAAASD
jgi:hypothetical protein